MSTKIEVKETKINVMNDHLFKALFRSTEARKMVSSFLSSVTGIDKEILMNADYIGGELPKRKKYEKAKTSDVIVLIDKHNRIIVEMNQSKSPNLFEKNVSYAFSNILESNLINDKTYPCVTMISLDNMNKFKTKSPILLFKIRDEENHIESNMYTSLHLILDNLVDSKYNKEVKEEIRKFSKFIKTKTLEELKENFEGDEEYMCGIDKIEDLISDPNFAGAYDLEEKHKFEIEDSHLGGYLEGKEEGEKNKQIEIVKSMLEEKISIETISRCTGLSIEEINTLVE